MYDHLKKPYPFPEALKGERGKSWSISKNSRAPHADLLNHAMEVPLETTPYARNIRAHEMGHAAWSPVASPAVLAKKHEVSPINLQVCEDCRINYLLVSAADINLSDGFLSLEESDKLYVDLRTLAKEDPVEAVATAVRLVLASENWRGAKILDCLGAEETSIVRDISYEAYRILLGKRHGRDFKPVVEAARYLDRVLGSKSESSRTVKTLKEEKEEKKEDSMDGGERSKAPKPPKVVEHVPWGDMTVECAPMRNNAKLNRIAPVWRSTDTGTRIRSLHRLRVDGKIFGWKSKQPGGTVLLDGSSSMGMSLETILEMVLAAPHATVAIYAGRTLKRGDYTTGALTILAKNGRITDAEGLREVYRKNNGGNIVDGPALEWLGKQEEPRVWVSDGFVTGVGDASTTELSADAHRLMRRGRITRVREPAFVVGEFLRARSAA